MEGIAKIKYCQVNKGNRCTCASVAEFKVVLQSRKDPFKRGVSYRCGTHKTKGTVGKKVIASEPVDQTEALKEVNRFLLTTLGKQIVSSMHTARYLIPVFIKNTGVMCRHPITDKWAYVYYHQIKEMLK